MLLALKLVSSLPKGFIIKLRDGRKLAIDLTTGMQERVFFFGEYEPYVTELVKQLVSEGNVCVDAGANFGWYTTLMADCVGPSGRVHAFEPVPSTFRELTVNTGLLAEPSSVVLNQLALSDSESEAEINVFDGEPTGHASLAKRSQNRATFRCRTIRLDEYLSASGISRVDFVKVDVEGGELGFLKGSEMMLGQKVPPIFVMEMAIGQSRHFGYVPNDLLEFMLSRADYNVFKIDEIKRCLIPIHRLPNEDPGANVLCIPANSEHRVQIVIDEHLSPLADRVRSRTGSPKSAIS